MVYTINGYNWKKTNFRFVEKGIYLKSESATTPTSVTTALTYTNANPYVNSFN